MAKQILVNEYIDESESHLASLLISYKPCTCIAQMSITAANSNLILQTRVLWNLLSSKFTVTVAFGSIPSEFLLHFKFCLRSLSLSTNLQNLHAKPKLITVECLVNHSKLISGFTD